MLTKIKTVTIDGGDIVRYGSDDNFKDFTPLDFLAALSAQIPNIFEQTIRYLGVYSARTRGKRNRDNLTITIIEDCDIYRAITSFAGKARYRSV